MAELTRALGRDEVTNDYSGGKAALSRKVLDKPLSDEEEEMCAFIDENDTTTEH